MHSLARLQWDGRLLHGHLCWVRTKQSTDSEIHGTPHQLAAYKLSSNRYGHRHHTPRSMPWLRVSNVGHRRGAHVAPGPGKRGAGGPGRSARPGKALHLPCVSTAFVNRTLPLPGGAAAEPRQTDDHRRAGAASDPAGRGDSPCECSAKACISPRFHCPFHRCWLRGYLCLSFAEEALSAVASADRRPLTARRAKATISLARPDVDLPAASEG